MIDDDRTIEVSTITVDVDTSAACAANTGGPANPLEGTPYAVVRKLGEGGMGEIFEARDVRGLRVVVKVLHAHFLSAPDIADRMRIEGEVLRSLSHPNVVAVHDFGQTRDGRSYLVMDRLQGRTLKDELRARKVIPVPEAIDFMCQALAGLHAAHALGIVHRDVKPDNLFVCAPAEGRQRVVVLDFGVAKVIGKPKGSRGLAPLTLPTAHGMLVGTPRYTAPEQLHTGPIDARTDVYAAGLVLYALLAGRGPFDHLPEGLVLRARLTEAPEPPSRYAPVPIPRELDGVVLRALERAPEDRYASALDFARALSLVANGYDTAVRAGGLRRGDRVGPYEVRHLINATGVTEVYEAVHHFTARVVALKCVQARQAAGEDLRERMRREATVLSRVRHGNVVLVYDAGCTPHGTAWSASERLRGRTLRELLWATPRLPLPVALRYATQIADGIRAVHEAGAIHGDLTPENVFVTEDFEIKILGAPAWTNDARGGPRRARGTPAYMAPEQLEGGTVDASADVYALGHILYEMLLGRHAYARREGGWPGCGRLIEMQLRKSPAPLTELTELTQLTQHTQQAMPLVWTALQPALSKKPEERPTMAELRRDLDAAQCHVRQRHWATGMPARWAALIAMRGRGAVLAAATVALALIALASFGGLLRAAHTVYPPSVQSTCAP